MTSDVISYLYLFRHSTDQCNDLSFERHEVNYGECVDATETDTITDEDSTTTHTYNVRGELSTWDNSLGNCGNFFLFYFLFAISTKYTFYV